MTSMRQGFWGRFGDLLVVLAVVGMIVLMIVPLSPGALDCFLTGNFALTLVILLVALHTTDPLHFSVFPSMLLVVTLFRLALNIAGTRLILLNAHAGLIIQAFGNVVVGGSYVVGAVVFVILVIIQFVVVTSGAQRVAEVAARFTLDAMPGKQMSIDADLSAGAITDDEARKRRKAIGDEADFYGAMDGASKFVRGDAIAAVIIILVNVVGGLVIGVVQNGMELVDALRTYTLLTVGEGLVTQIPALLVSTATGIVVTRAASSSNLGEDLSSQLLSKPRALAIAACLLLAMLAVPGLPRVPFLMIGSGLALGAWAVWRRPAPEEGSGEAPAASGDLSEALDVDVLELIVGSGLLGHVDRARGGALLERITAVRRDIAMEYGVLVPPLRVRDVSDEPGGSYTLRLNGLVVARGEARPALRLAIPSKPVVLEGEETVEPATGMRAYWIEPSAAPAAEEAGCTVCDAVTVMGTHLYHVLVENAWELLGRQEVRRLLDRQKQARPALVDDLVPNTLGVGEVQRVLRNLLRERVPIRNLAGILEAIADAARLTRNPEEITELVRVAMSRMIAQRFQNADGQIYVVSLSPELEAIMHRALKRPDRDPFSLLGMNGLNSVYDNLRAELVKMRRQGLSPLVLTLPQSRAVFKGLCDRVAPDLTVLSISEIPPGVKCTSVGVVEVGSVDPIQVPRPVAEPETAAWDDVAATRPFSPGCPAWSGWWPRYS